MSVVDCPQYAVDELNGHPLKLKDAILEQGGPTILNFRYPEHFSVSAILVWIRFRGSMLLTNGSGFGSGILLFSSLTFQMPTKNKFCLLLFEGYIYIIFQR
jgi:hypothetical protein